MVSGMMQDGIPPAHNGLGREREPEIRRIGAKSIAEESGSGHASNGKRGSADDEAWNQPLRGRARNAARQVR